MIYFSFEKTFTDWIINLSIGFSSTVLKNIYIYFYIQFK